ncbi:hypothetical protein NL676_038826 [Syzygium grande]|nr:hypothetical protein NL676_038826 [Syzygium grande]
MAIPKLEDLQKSPKQHFLRYDSLCTALLTQTPESARPPKKAPSPSRSFAGNPHRSFRSINRSIYFDQFHLPTFSPPPHPSTPNFIEKQGLQPLFELPFSGRQGDRRCNLQQERVCAGDAGLPERQGCITRVIPKGRVVEDDQ